MRKLVLLLLVVVVNCGVSAQSVCEIEMSKKNYKEYNKALEMFEKGMYTGSGNILRKIVQEEPEVAEPYFVLRLPKAILCKMLSLNSILSCDTMPLSSRSELMFMSFIGMPSISISPEVQS